MRRTSEIPIRQSITVFLVWMIFSACSLLMGVTFTPAFATKRPTRNAPRTSMHATLTGLTPKGSLPTDTPGIQPTDDASKSRLPAKRAEAVHRIHRSKLDDGSPHTYQPVIMASDSGNEQ